MSSNGNASSDTDRFDPSPIQKVGIRRIPATVGGGCVPERVPLTFRTGFYSGTELHKTTEIQHLLPLLLTTSDRSVNPATERERGDR